MSTTPHRSQKVVAAGRGGKLIQRSSQRTLHLIDTEIVFPDHNRYRPIPSRPAAAAAAGINANGSCLRKTITLLDTLALNSASTPTANATTSSRASLLGLVQFRKTISHPPTHTHTHTHSSPEGTIDLWMRR